MIEHPINPSLNGKNLSNLKDVNGKTFFTEFVKLAKYEGSGVVDYYWNVPGEDTAQLKVSYVKLLKEFDWIIGTGAYVSDVAKKMQNEALKTISKMQFGNGGYFWVNDLSAKMIMHPINPSLNGKNLSKTKDPNGVYLFSEMAKLAKQKGSGIVKYSWEKPNEKEPQPKISFIKLFKPWGWVVGTGEYVDNIEKNVLKMQKEANEEINGVIIEIALTSVVVAIMLFVLVSFIANRSISRPIK